MMNIIEEKVDANGVIGNYLEKCEARKEMR